MKDKKIIAIALLTVALVITAGYAINERRHFNNLAAAGVELISANKEVMDLEKKDYNILYYDYLSLKGKYEWMTRDRNALKIKAAAFDMYSKQARDYGEITIVYEGGVLNTYINK